MGAVGVAPPHRADRSVAVEVVRRILVDKPVIVVVPRRLSSAAAVRRAHLAEPRRTAVRVHGRHEVERDPVDEGGELRVAPMRTAEAVDRVEHSLRRLKLVAVHVAVDPHGGFRWFRTCRRVVHDDHKQRAALRACADPPHREQVRIGRHEPVHDVADLVLVVVAVPCDVDWSGTCDRCRRRRWRALRGGCGRGGVLSRRRDGLPA